MLERNRADVPDLPEGLSSVLKRPALLHELLPTSDGLGGRLTVANVGSEPFSGNAICVQDWAQVPCSDERSIFAIDLPPWSAAQHDLVFADADDSVIFVLLLVEDDRLGVESVSIAHLIHQPEGWEPTDHVPVEAGTYAIASPFPGCGVAAFHDGRSLDDGYELPRTVDRNRLRSVLIDACEEHGEVWMTPLLVVNRQALSQVSWVGTVFVFDRSMELPIPASLLEDQDVTSLQFVVVIHEDGSFLTFHTPEVTLE